MSSNTTEHGEHFNESIVNEEILEDMKKNRIDHMKYLPGMETMEESDVMEQVITAMNAYDYDQYTEKDVRRALEHDNRTVEDFQALSFSCGTSTSGRDRAGGESGDKKTFWKQCLYVHTNLYRKLL